MQTICNHDIEQAALLLRLNEVVAIPTETVYGLAANALEPKAVVKIFEAKNRPFFDPLIVHIADKKWIGEYASDIPEKAFELADVFWPGPLTLVLKRKTIIPDLVTAGLDTVGIRMPNHPVALELLSKLDFPLAAPSANPFGYISPTSAQHVMNQLNGIVPMVLDGGPCLVGVESTIVQCIGNEVKVLRLGGISIEALESVVGRVRQELNTGSNPLAPGQLTSHYAPRKQVLMGDIEAMIKAAANQRIAVLSFKKRYGDARGLVLSASGNLHEAAQNLFSMMRQLDESDADLILTEPLPDEGLGRAINDRLRRACAK